MRAYFHLWKNWLNFKGKTSRHDFWVSGILFNLFGGLINLSESLFLILRYDIAAEQAVRGPVFIVYSCLGLVGLISMSVRRLRDGGFWNKSSWKFLIPIVGFVRLVWCLYIEKSAQNDIYI